MDCVEAEKFFDSRDHDHGEFHDLTVVGVVASLLYSKQFSFEGSKNYDCGRFHGLAMVHSRILVGLLMPSIAVEYSMGWTWMTLLVISLAYILSEHVF